MFYPTVCSHALETLQAEAFASFVFVFCRGCFLTCLFSNKAFSIRPFLVACSQTSRYVFYETTQHFLMVRLGSGRCSSIYLLSSLVQDHELSSP